MPALTPAKLRALCLLAECRLLSLPQIALLLEGSELRPKAAREKSARRHLRELFDARLIAVLPVPRSALAGRDAPNDASLLFGSAPNVYAPTVAGVRLVSGAGLVSPEVARRYGVDSKAKKNSVSVAPYGPKNSLFLAHELLVRDVRVWAERLVYAVKGSAAATVERWEDGEAATLPLLSGLDARPDALLVLRTGTGCLAGLCEADRGTERGTTRWREKVERYGKNGNEPLRNARVTAFSPMRRAIASPASWCSPRTCAAVTRWRRRYGRSASGSASRS